MKIGGVEQDNIHKTAVVTSGTAESKQARAGCRCIDWVETPGQIGNTAPIKKCQIPVDHDEAQAKRQRFVVMTNQKNSFWSRNGNMLGDPSSVHADPNPKRCQLGSYLMIKPGDPIK